MFKKIQSTFSIHFLNSNYLVSLQNQCLFLRPGGSVRLHMSQTDIEVTDCTCNCSMQVEHVFSSGENVHVASEGKILEQVGVMI